MNTKTCKGCLKTLPLESFGKTKQTKDGREGKCKECRKKQREKYVIVCKECGNKFRTSEQDAKFCGMACAGVARRSRVQTNCAYCKSGISVLKSRYKKDKQLYCDQECRSNHLKITMASKGNPNYNRVSYECDGCHKNIMVVPSDIEDGRLKFCSNECYKENIGQYFTGDKNNYYNHNLSNEERRRTRRYKAYYQWRDAVFHKNKYTCCKCQDRKGGNLNAHHIYNYSDYPERRVDITNGITLCKECHIQFHKENGYKENNHYQIQRFLRQTLL